MLSPCAGPHRIEIFHVADRQRLVGAVADDFVFELFPAEQELLDQDLGAPWSAWVARSLSSASFSTLPEPRPPSEKPERIITG